MNKHEFCDKYRKEIAVISTLLRDKGFDLGMAEAVFCNAARRGMIPDGDDPAVRAALATLGGSDYWEDLSAEYAEVVI